MRGLVRGEFHAQGAGLGEGDVALGGRLRGELRRVGLGRGAVRVEDTAQAGEQLIALGLGLLRGLRWYLALLDAGST
ncbi:hypothetical protein LUR56_40680, partial [Streptomyces sp. MT29]|nr:hypothetical protein [Streptomyces sp. MT29]